MFNPTEKVNALQAIHEIERRLRAMQFGEGNQLQSAGRWACIAEISKVKKEITDGIFARMRATVESFTDNDDQPTDDEVDASDAADYLNFLKQCRP